MLETGVVEASEAPVLRRHVVVVLVDRLDLATARALQYARTLVARRPAGRALRHRHQGRPRSSSRSGAASDWPGCRSTSSSAPTAASAGPPSSWWPTPRSTATPSAPSCCRAGATAQVWQRFLHDRTADKIAAVLGQVPHVSATIVPFDVGGRFGERVRSYGRSVQRAAGSAAPAPTGRAPVDPEGRTGVDRIGPADGPRAPGARRSRPTRRWPSAAGATTPIADVASRQRVRVAGRVKSVRVQPRAGTSNLECVLSDGTGGLLLVFQGRPKIAGIEPGARPGGRGHGGRLGPAARHAEPLVRAGGRARRATRPSRELIALDVRLDRDPNCPHRPHSR